VPVSGEREEGYHAHVHLSEEKMCWRRGSAIDDLKRSKVMTCSECAAGN
jgi:hypothetical protein